MPELVTVRCLKDNYAWIVHHEGRTVLFDAPEAGPILAALKTHGWGLDDIALTHHHDDHIQAVDAIVTETGARVTGAARDAHRLPPLDHKTAPGERVNLAGMETTVIDAAGHTSGHIAFHLPQAGIVVTGDSLMAMGCGRLSECDAATMWDTLQRLDALPPDTLVCSGHDYCASNAAFALSVEPDNDAVRERAEKVAAGEASCAPTTLSRERQTNPFLRAALLANLLDMPDAEPVEVFAKLRAMKDSF